MVKGAGLVCVLLLFGLGIAGAQSMRVLPDHVLADESAAVVVAGLNAHEHVVLRAELVDGAGQRWSSEAEFTADGTGGLDTAVQAPVKGSYRPVSGLGLLWSMRPAGRGARAYQRPPEDAPQSVEFHLLKDGRVVTKAELVEQFRKPGIREVRLHGALHGSLFLPSGEGPWPGLLVVGGAEGGAPVEKALWLASHGYAAVAVAYFGQDGLPEQLEHIPLEYFGRALAWMQGQPEISRGKLGVVGSSRGGELALELATVYRAVRVAVAYSPASVRYPSCCGRWVTAAWTLRGQPLEHISAVRGTRDRAATEEAAAIEVERAHGDILVISGGQDGIWPSSLMTQELAARLREADFPHRFERLDYPHAGHWAGSPEIVPAWAREAVDPRTGELGPPGGSAEGNAESGVDAGPKVLRFLAQAFGEVDEMALQGADGTGH